MLPIRDVIPIQTTPHVVRAVMRVQVGITMLIPALAWLGVRDPLAELPADTSAAFILPFSIMVPPWWLPAVANAWVLWVLGDTVEDRLSHGRFVALYLLAAVVGLTAQVFLSPLYALPPAGAGAAAAGVLGAHVALFPRGRVLAAALVPWRFELLEPPALVAIGLWLLVHLFAGTDAFALLGGGLLGLAAGRLLARRERMKPDWWGAVVRDS